MPLQVWLPLTKDYSNQGLSDIEVSNNGATLTTTGKLGGSYYFNGSAQYLQFNKSLGDIYTKDFSYAAWVNPSDSTRSIIISEYASSGSSNVAYELTASRGIRLYWNGSPDIYPTNCTLPLDTWSHTAIVKTTNKVDFYVNGELRYTYTGTLSDRVSTSCIRIGDDYRGGTSVSFMGYLNDVRIYDHALSPKEVKLLSQGLVAHYQLNDAWLEGTTNLASKPDCLSSTCYNGAKGTYGYGTNTDMYKTVGVFEGKLCTKLYMGTSGASARPYPYISNLFVSNGTNAPAYKTLSFDYFSTIGTYINPYKLGSGNATCNWTNPSASPSSGIFTNSGNIPIVAGKWNHITMTLHGTTDANAEWGYIVMGDTHTSNTSNYWLFANMQLEEKDHATGYTDGTRSETMVYDSSGFNYHMTAVGSPTLSSGSIRNNICTHFINGQYAVAQQNANLYLPKDSITVNLWIKCSTWGNPISCTEGGGWNFEDIGSGLQFPAYISGVGYKIANSGISPSTLLNAWHMLTGTFDGTTLKIYIDAQLKATTSTGSTNGIGYAANRLIISGEAQGATPASSTYVGDISDVRIYATALSADDVLNLYNAPVSIANNGTMVTQGEFVEV